MTEAELRAHFLERVPIYKGWGDFVTGRILEGITETLNLRGDRRAIREFLKVPAEPRVKGVDSFIGKALHRDKGYQNPLDQITDPVGVRFVVLLSSEIEILNDVISKSRDWEPSQDRDFERDRLARPHFFEYESNHFIIRNAAPRNIAGVVIPVGTPCEVQVRTLLQHAYAELSHDRLYKPECKVSDAVRRLVARGSALLETTDVVFCEVSDGIERGMAAIRVPHEAALKQCVRLGVCGTHAPAQISFRLLEQFPDQLEFVTEAALEEFLRTHSYVPRRMKGNEAESILFSHPAGLIAYWLVDRLHEAVVPRWPFDQQLLDIVAADLGISIRG